ncbi:MAG: AI-2E family transporter [Eggerthellaceae bacterium]|nr:AI-2E family transporter [Eggerthellaceae bacterium]
MSYNEQDNQDAVLREEEIKTLKSRRRLYAGVFIIVLAVLLYLAGQVLNILANPIAIVVWTTIIVFCLKGPVNNLEKKGISRVWGSCVSFLLLIVTLILLFWLLFSPSLGLGGQFASLIETIPGQINDLTHWLNQMYDQYSYIFQDDRVNSWINDTLKSIGGWFSSIASVSAEGVMSAGSSVANTALVLGFSLVVSFWVLIELPALGREIKRLFGPRYHDDLNIIYLTGTRVMGGYIKGTLLQCLLIGVGCGVGYAVMGIPSAAALGVITGLLNIIPVIGPWLGGAVAALISLFVSPLIALISLVYTIVIQQVVYTFISPKIMGNSVDIHPALVILALMTGSALGFAVSGFLGSIVGMLVSIPAVAAAKSLFVYYFEKKTGRIIVSEDGVIFKGEPSGSEANPVADATGEFYVPEITPSQGKHRK